MSDKPTGVFVRLPLSEERAITFHKESSHAWDEFNGSSNALACEAGLLAIGTPVTGEELQPIGKVAGHFSDGQPMVRILNHPHLPYETEIALYSDAQAQITALEAEVVRLREALEGIENANNNLCFMRSNDTYQSMIRDGCKDLLVKLNDARCAAREALKGGAA